jgi:fatty acid desaturase
MILNYNEAARDRINALIDDAHAWYAEQRHAREQANLAAVSQLMAECRREQSRRAWRETLIALAVAAAFAAAGCCCGAVLRWLCR